MAPSARELWKGTNGDAWPVSAWHNPTLYPGGANASTIDIQSNVGRLFPSTANATQAGGIFLRRAPVQDCEITLSIDHASNLTQAIAIIGLRATLDMDANARPTNSVNMILSQAGDTVTVDKEIAGANTSLSGAVAFTQTSGTLTSIRFRVVGPSIKAKWWATASIEPSAWNYETNDGSTVFPGYVSLLYLSDAGGNSAKFTDFTYTDLTPAPPLLTRLLKAKRRQPVKAARLNPTGTLATTNANDTLAASGSSVTGTLAKTNADDTLAASGVVGASGTLAKTNNNDTLAGTGAAGGAAGTLAKTNANDTLAASGSSTTGSLAKTNANDTSVGTGATGPSGTLARTNANDALAGSGAAGGAAGTLATSNANDSLSAVGTVSGTTVTGSLAATNANDALSAEGTVPTTGGGLLRYGRVDVTDRLDVLDTVDEEEALVLILIGASL